MEKDHRKVDRSSGFAAIKANANYVEGRNSKAKPKKNKVPKTKQFMQSAFAPKCKNMKKFKGACYICGKSGHKAQDCYHCKDGNHANGNNNHANMAITDEELPAVVSEVNMVSNVSEWLMDTGATKHICADINLFTETILLPQEESCIWAILPHLWWKANTKWYSNSHLERVSPC